MNPDLRHMQEMLEFHTKVCLLSMPIRMHEVARQRTFFSTQPCVQTPVILQQLIATRTVPINHSALFHPA